MPFFREIFGGNKKTGKTAPEAPAPAAPQEAAPSKKVDLVPGFTPDAELDALTVKIEEAIRYKTASVMDGSPQLIAQAAERRAEVDAFLETKKDSLDTYLAPYFALARQYKAENARPPFPISTEEKNRLGAATALLIWRGEY